MPKYFMVNKKLILRVKRNKSSGQRRVNIPKRDETLEEDDLVELKKVEVK